MIDSLLQRVIPDTIAARIYTTPVQRQRAIGLIVVNLLLAAGYLGWLFVDILPSLVRGQAPSLGFFHPLLFAPVVVAPVILVLLWRGSLNAGAWLFVVTQIVSILPILALQFDNPLRLPLSAAVVLILPLVAAGSLLRRGEMLVIIAVTGVIIAGRTYLLAQTNEPFLIIPANGTVADTSLIGGTALLAALFLIFLRGSMDVVIQQTLDGTALLQRIVSFVPNLRTDNEVSILEQTIALLNTELRYDTAQIYLLDEQGNLQRRIRSGLGRLETGAEAQLRPSDASIISDVARSRQPLVVNRGDERQGHLILPARAALALPVRYGDTLLGVLDIHSQRRFSESEMRALEVLADELGDALTLARTVADLRRSAREQEETTRQFRQQIAQLRQTAEMVAVGSRERSTFAFGFDLISKGSEPVPVISTDMPAGLRPALERGETVITTEGDTQVVNLPIQFRGETLGAMTFAIPSQRPLTPQQLELAQVVSERLGLALENSRLFEQSQAQARRERQASEVAAALIGATDVRSVLDLAAESFNQALGAVYTRVYLQPVAPAYPFRLEDR